MNFVSKWFDKLIEEKAKKLVKYELDRINFKRLNKGYYLSGLDERIINLSDLVDRACKVKFEGMISDDSISRIVEKYVTQEANTGLIRECHSIVVSEIKKTINTEETLKSIVDRVNGLQLKND